MYYDGANMNAIMGITRPGDMGFDVVHLNLHKTFQLLMEVEVQELVLLELKRISTFLPIPVIERKEDKYVLNYDREKSIGKIKNFYGNFGVLVRAYTYILTMGRDGLKEASEMAVLNANYIKESIKDDYILPIDTLCKHEFVLGGLPRGEANIKTIDIAKDY